MRHYILPILFIVMAVFGMGAIAVVTIKTIQYSNKKPVIIDKNKVAVYDSLNNVVAYKDHKDWIILNDKLTVKVLENEIYRLIKINQYTAFKYDSLLKVKTK